jgi:hypothetical protein
MTTATVFNAYDVIQTEGPTSDWVDNGSGEVVVYGGTGGTVFRWEFTLKSGMTVPDLWIVRLDMGSGDWFQVGVNGEARVQFYNGPNTYDFLVTNLTEIAYEQNNYGDSLGTFTLLRADYGYPEIVLGFTPLWTSYRNTTEFEL